MARNGNKEHSSSPGNGSTRRPSTRRKRPVLGTALAMLFTLSITAACADNITSRGQIPDPDDVARLKIGYSSQEDVYRLLGTPSHVSAFDGFTWYYIGHKSEAFAFFEPEILERKILQLKFDSNGLLSETKGLDLADGREIEPEERVTPTEGRELTFLQQMLGNIGRFPGAGQSQPNF